MARSVSENLNWGVGEDDYLDLEKTKDKKIIYEFHHGYSPKGYLDMCNYCNGAEKEKYIVCAAEQVEKRLEGRKAGD